MLVDLFQYSRMILKIHNQNSFITSRLLTGNSRQCAEVFTPQMVPPAMYSVCVAQIDLSSVFLPRPTDWMLIALTELTRLFIRVMSLVVTSFSARLKPRRRKLNLRRRSGKC